MNEGWVMVRYSGCNRWMEDGLEDGCMYKGWFRMDVMDG